MSEIKVEKSIMKIEKTLKFYQIGLIYCSKLKSNATWRKIREKTCNLTQNCARNDPIHHWIKAFHFAFQKTKIQSLSSEFSLFSQQNLDFKHSSDAEMSLEEEEIKRFKDWGI